MGLNGFGCNVNNVVDFEEKNGRTSIPLTSLHTIGLHNRPTLTRHGIPWETDLVHSKTFLRDVNGLDQWQRQYRRLSSFLDSLNKGLHVRDDLRVKVQITMTEGEYYSGTVE